MMGRWREDEIDTAVIGLQAASTGLEEIVFMGFGELGYEALAGARMGSTLSSLGCKQRVLALEKVAIVGIEWHIEHWPARE